MKRFAEWEKDFIRLAYPNTPVKEIASFLGRSEGTLFVFASKHGLSTPGKISPKNVGLTPEERSRENDRRARETKKRLGKCSDCAAMAVVGSVFCDACKEKRQTRNNGERRVLMSQRKCLDCRKDVDDERFKRCRTCLDAHNDLQRRKRGLLGENGLCTTCGKVPHEDGRRFCDECRKMHNKNNRILTRRLKNAAYSAYGGYMCRCCGETERLFLAIDHIDGNGHEHRKRLSESGKCTSTRRLYGWLKKMGYPPGFQILCHNCNMGKHLNGNVCPHKSSSISWLFSLSS